MIKKVNAYADGAVCLVQLKDGSYHPYVSAEWVSTALRDSDANIVINRTLDAKLRLLEYLKIK